ncbi:MAG: cytochrome P450 [Ktedonobacteraceae bacterium]|nr:cytochrome P450 [Ktedonobacteraceae bacterium]
MQEETLSPQEEPARCPHENRVSSLEADYAPLSQSHTANPYQIYARMRQEDPVFFSPLTRSWVVSRYDDVVAILKDHQRFAISVAHLSENWYTPEVAELMRSRPFANISNLLMVDPPVHTRMRTPITRAMSASRIASLEPRIRQFADRLIDQFVPDTRLDFMQHFARPFPPLVIGSLMGIPEEDLPQLQQWDDDQAALHTQPDASHQLQLAQSTIAVEQYLYDLVKQRSLDPQEDLISDILKAMDAGQVPLSPLEAACVLYTLFGAGFETTVQFLGNCLLTLLSERTHWQAICDHPQSIPVIVEELLRFNSPSLSTFRQATEDVELGGQTIPKGAMIQVLLASADHDEAQFAAGDAFDPQREKTNRHVTFGYGVHFCLGAPLARLETRIALEQLSQRLPSLRLVPDQEISYTPDLLFHGVKQLLVEWPA